MKTFLGLACFRFFMTLSYLSTFACFGIILDTMINQKMILFINLFFFALQNMAKLRDLIKPP